jgi:hypothetical protein
VQIPKFWEPIKTAVAKADEVQEKDLQSYMNELLHALLNDKAQCFIVLDENRVLKGMLLTRIIFDKVLNEKYISLNSIYAWDKLSDADYKEGYALIMKFAETEKCKYIQGRSRHDHVRKIAKSLGFTERYTVFDLQLK